MNFTEQELVAHPEPDEAFIIEQAKLNSEYFQPLYVKYYEQIFRFIFKKVKEKEVAADITSEVFLNALNGLKKYQNLGFPFSSWLYKIAINQTMIYFKKNKQQRYVILNDDIIENLQPVFSSFSFESDELKNQLIILMQHLSIIEVQLIELRFYESLSFLKIGELMDMSEETSKKKTYRALDKIRKKLNGSKRN